MNCWSRSGAAAKAEPATGSSAITEPTSPAASRWLQPNAGIRRAIRPRSCAGISSRTENAKQSQPSQPITTSAQRNSRPSSGLVSNWPMPSGAMSPIAATALVP